MKSIRVDMEKPSFAKEIALTTISVTWAIITFIPTLISWALTALGRSRWY